MNPFLLRSPFLSTFPSAPGAPTHPARSSFELVVPPALLALLALPDERQVLAGARVRDVGDVGLLVGVVADGLLEHEHAVGLEPLGAVDAAADDGVHDGGPPAAALVLGVAEEGVHAVGDFRDVDASL